MVIDGLKQNPRNKFDQNINQELIDVLTNSRDGSTQNSAYSFNPGQLPYPQFHNFIDSSIDSSDSCQDKNSAEEDLFNDNSASNGENQLILISGACCVGKKEQIES